MNLQEIWEAAKDNIDEPIDYVFIIIVVGYLAWLVWFIRNDK